MASGGDVDRLRTICWTRLKNQDRPTGFVVFGCLFVNKDHTCAYRLLCGRRVKVRVLGRREFELYSARVGGKSFSRWWRISVTYVVSVWTRWRCRYYIENGNNNDDHHHHHHDDDKHHHYYQHYHFPQPLPFFLLLLLLFFNLLSSVVSFIPFFQSPDIHSYLFPSSIDHLYSSTFI